MCFTLQPRIADVETVMEHLRDKVDDPWVFLKIQTRAIARQRELRKKDVENKWMLNDDLF